MSLISKSRLRHPAIMTAFLLGLSLVSLISIFNAVKRIGAANDLHWAFIPAAFTLAAWVHAKLPTKIGWYALLAVLAVPAAWEIQDGLFSVYSGLEVKYGWADFFELALIDSLAALVIALFLFASRVMD